MNAIDASSLAGRGVAYSAAIARAAHDHGLDPTLLAAVAAQETGGPDANAGRNIVGDGGHGHGLFQIDDRYHPFARTSAAMDPTQNAEYAAGMISGLIHRYGSVHRALSAYNAGDPDATGTTTQWSDGSRLGYADSVLRHAARIAGGTFDDSNAVVADHTSAPTAGSAAAGLAAPALAAPAMAFEVPPPAHRHHFDSQDDSAYDNAYDNDDTYDT